MLEDNKGVFLICKGKNGDILYAITGYTEALFILDNICIKDMKTLGITKTQAKSLYKIFEVGEDCKYSNSFKSKYNNISEIPFDKRTEIMSSNKSRLKGVF